MKRGFIGVEILVKLIPIIIIVVLLLVLSYNFFDLFGDKPTNAENNFELLTREIEDAIQSKESQGKIVIPQMKPDNAYSISLVPKPTTNEEKKLCGNKPCACLFEQQPTKQKVTCKTFTMNNYAFTFPQNIGYQESDKRRSIKLDWFNNKLSIS